MGAGPLALLADDAVPARLTAAGVDVETTWLDELAEPEHETGRVFELDRRLSQVVADVRASGRLPAIFAGNCIACLGAVGGIAEARLGILWLDAHPDFHTPETTASGFLDGTGLAAATGACWRTLCASIPGFAPVAEEDVVLAGVRDIDPGEAERLRRGAVTAVRGGREPGRFDVDAVDRAVAGLAVRVAGLYLHLDLDVIDPRFGSANEYATPGGLTPDEVLTVATAAHDRIPVHALSFTAYDPSADGDGRFADTAIELAASLLAELAGAEPSTGPLRRAPGR
jgi:arginase